MMMMMILYTAQQVMSVWSFIITVTQIEQLKAMQESHNTDCFYFIPICR